MAKILVVAESQGDMPERATLSAITAAREASTILDSGFDILVVGGPGATRDAAALTCYGAEHVLLVEDATMSVYLAENFVDTVSSVARGYSLVVAAATTFGKDLLPRVAGNLDAAYAADCSGVTEEAGALSFKRPMHAGNVLGFVKLGTRIQVATVRQCDFEAAVPSAGKSPIQVLQSVAPGKAAARIEVVSQKVMQNDRRSLADAKTVVSGGRALKDRFFEILDPLASVLGAAIGATRIACHAGYAPGNLQVGQSGNMVAPRLYIAIGISGSIQHVAGMRGSKVIVAINRDPQAPVFQLADYGLVADLFEAVPEMVRHIQLARKDVGAH